MKDLLRQMPAVHELQKDARFEEIIFHYNADANHITEISRDLLSNIRSQLLNEEWVGPEPGTVQFDEELFKLIGETAAKRFDFTLKQVINATGTILHTNLGRARLSENAMKHVMETAQNYSNLEYKLTEGVRGSRHSHVETLIKEITGAEAAMVVNNNAAAVFIILSALAKNREVIVSRGQLVEIGGSFRISSIMEESGATLVEVGTTNKTHLSDYERAITEETAMILKVHTSNFKILGFTKSVETTELADLASKQKNVIFYEDLGSGVLYDFRKHLIGDEPVVKEIIKMGADIVSFSGDKLLGGPQAGIIAGKKELIDRLKKHQLARVVRVDKMTLAALEGTLIDYLRGEKGIIQIPAVRDLLVPIEELKTRAEVFAEKINNMNGRLKASVSPGTSQVGGGTMPEVQLDTFIAKIVHDEYSAEYITKMLRVGSSPAIVARINKDEVHFDLRTVTPEEEAHILHAMEKFI